MEGKAVQRQKNSEDRNQAIGQRTSGWILWGLAVSILTSFFYLSCYSLFRNRAEAQGADHPIEFRQETTDWLMENTYVLYRDLRQKESPDAVSYEGLYVKPCQDCEWVLDESLRQVWMREETLDLNDIPADAGRVYSYLEYLNHYFQNLEENFPTLNSYFGYRCEDLLTGESVGNLDASELQLDSSHFYLSFVFDGYGNCTVETAKLGENSTNIRKMANQSARALHLENDETYLEYTNSASVGLETYLTLGAPKNCRVTYSISDEEWQERKAGAALYVDGSLIYYVESNPYYAYYSCGADSFFVYLWFLVAGVAFLLPLRCFAQSAEQGKGGSGRMSHSPELILVLICLGLGFGTSLVLNMLSGILSGESAKTVGQYLQFLKSAVNGPILIYFLLYVANFLLLVVLFGLAWYVGLNLRDIRRLGLWRYVKERSGIYAIFPFVRSRIGKLYDSFSHFDVTKKANKMILKLVLINGVIVFLISNLWVGGFAAAVVYSILLYFILRKYISDLQKKYGILLNATNKIAQGNLNVQIPEDLGVFEPFKPQVYRIQNGFRNAVDQEVKSQRMKAELITNVSHDLKTPLTAIITYIELLKNENITEEQRREYLDTLERKSLRLKVLIEDLFEVSKADSQSMKLNIMDVDIGNLVKQVAFEMGDKFAERKLELRMSFPEEKVLLPLDSQRTYRIFENLFGNIAKYAMPGTRVYVNGICDRDRVIITLKNISAQEISVNPKELTERFVRGDASRNTEGSGLGLAIAKSFTQLQGGKLDIEVDGDLFKVTLTWQRRGQVPPQKTK